VIVESVLPEGTVASAALPPVAAAATESMVQPAAPSLPPSDGTPPPQAGAGHCVVQLGAFRDYGNARNFLAHSREQVVAVAGEPRVSQVDGLWRVYVGPYDNAADAKRIGDRLYASLGIDSTVAEH
ncbi:MAG: SPOR domain-containing protein, partial [Casimicrobiaceae bacterium]